MSLGKTNITTLSEGAIVTEVEEFKWLQMQSGVLGNFVKAIYKNGYLVAITADGMVVYTTDGETWQTSTLEYADCKLNDIEWDGSRFILVGSYTNTIENLTGTVGLILTTSDLISFVPVNINNEDDDYSTETKYYDIEYHAIYMQNGHYIILANRHVNGSEDIYLYEGDLTNDWSNHTYIFGKTPKRGTVSFAKNSSEMLVCFNALHSSQTYYNYVYKVNGTHAVQIKELSSGYTSVPMVSAIECKDLLYYMSKLSNDKYEFAKVSESNEIFIMNTEKNFAFKSGVYFNECQLFINNHEMLVVKKGENIADKTLDNLIEIAPELTMNCITKAFGQLYIFGNQGVILKSSVETNNEEAVTVQALSAKRALGEAKAYTDQQYALLEARIAALEGAPETK